jgi:DNA polymerase/3'-5' exonuclease PolX
MSIRHNYSDAEADLKKIEKYLIEKGYQYSVTGSMRRKTTTIGDIDIIIKESETVFDKIVSEFKEVDKITDRNKFVVALKSGILLQLIFVEENYVYHLWSSTGSKKHVKNIKEIYKIRRIELSKDILSEKEIYKKIGMDFIQPEKREEV